MPQRCCKERDARYCMRKRPGMHNTSPEPLPDIVVPHYEGECGCFSCEWVRETERRVIPSRTGHSEWPCHVLNPTYNRVPQDGIQRLLTSGKKKKFQIMYIYAMELENKTWGWVVVLPRPLLPFLLTDVKYSGISNFVRHPMRGWYGIKANGARVVIDQEMVPPLYNPFYQHYGYEPQCSPYRLYQPPAMHNASRNEANPSSGHQTALNQTSPPAEKPTDPSAEFQASTPPEAQATSSNPPADQSASKNEDWLNNEEWVVADPRCANAPQPYGFCNDNCKFAHHNGKYYGVRCGNQYANWRNTTIFVGCLNACTTEEDLYQWFKGFGELMHVRKQPLGTYAFVQYAGRKEAEMAISQMQGYPISGARLRLAWGKPERQMDPRYWNYHMQSAREAHNAC